MQLGEKQQKGHKNETNFPSRTRHQMFVAQGQVLLTVRWDADITTLLLLQLVEKRTVHYRSPYLSTLLNAKMGFQHLKNDD